MKSNKVRDLEEEGTWFLEASSEFEAKVNAETKKKQLEEVGIEIEWELEGVNMESEDTVSFKTNESDEDVGAIYEISYTVIEDTWEADQ